MENQRIEYIIPLTDVSSQDDNFSDEEDDDSTCSYHSYDNDGNYTNNHVVDDDASSQCSCSDASSNSSASISIASNSESAFYDDTTFDDDTTNNESDEESSECSDDYTGEDDESDEEEEDDEEDWGYKFFPDHDTRIRFSAEVEVHDTLRRDDYTAAEKMASFLTPKDKKAQWFYQNKAIAKLEWWLEESPEHRVLHKQEVDDRGDDKFIPRGLHQMTDKGYDRMNAFKNACVEAVLREQEAQWTAAGRPTRGILWNFDAMASVSMQVSKGGIVESIKIAKRDEQQAQKAYRQMEESNKRSNKGIFSSSRRVLSNSTQTILNNNNNTATVPSNIKKALHKNRSPSPGTTTPTTVTTTLTASGEDSESALQQQQQQPLDYLEVASIESTPSLLTYLDDRSIVTPDDEQHYREQTRRMSLQEQLHPMCVLHESHHSFMTGIENSSGGGLELGGGIKRRRASAPPLRNQSTMSSLSRGE